MGQAKTRGSQASRVEQALARERAKLPASVQCNRCQADLADITPLSTRGYPGMWLMGKAICRPCDCITWVLEGEPDAVMQLQFTEQVGPE